MVVFLIFKIVILYVRMFGLCVVMVYMSAVPSESRRGHHIAWNWNYKGLQTTMLVCVCSLYVCVCVFYMYVCVLYLCVHSVCVCVLYAHVCVCLLVGAHVWVQWR